VAVLGLFCLELPKDLSCNCLAYMQGRLAEPMEKAYDGWLYIAHILTVYN